LGLLDALLTTDWDTLFLHPSLLMSPASLPPPIQATGSVHTSINTGPAGRSVNYRISSFPHSDLGLIFLDFFPQGFVFGFLGSDSPVH